jgi:DNA-binding NarL/FixJ family response regulator
MRVLLADQRPDVRLALAILFNKEPGVNVVGSVSETEGLLSLARSAHPDIVVLDCDLPGDRTESVLNSLHVLDHNLKVLLLNASSKPITRTQLTNIDAIVSKNDSPEILLEKFHMLLAA